MPPCPEGEPVNRYVVIWALLWGTCLVLWAGFIWLVFFA